ncbi:MAG: Fur family transcriptional regulator [Dehalococcoidia bacterium]|jgi:Fur family ferric uptake transcriptional regulator
MRLTANRIAGILRENGYKLTPQRHIVLKVIASSNDLLTPDSILEKSRQEDPSLGRVTVYRTLEVLNKLSLVCKVHSEGRCGSYMMKRPTEHHHHLVCSGCGKAVDITNCSLIDIEKKLSQESGFEIKGHLLEFYGLCHDCVENTPTIHSNKGGTSR